MSKADNYRCDAEFFQQKNHQASAQLEELMVFLRRGVKVETITPEMIAWCKENYPNDHMVLTNKKFFVFQEVAQAALFKTFWC